MTLYIVATPIGNLEDVTLRALRILKEVDVILCEDTRVTKKLLNHYDIATPTQSFNSHASDAKFQKIISELAEGKNVALVCDAGTPTISDPGSKLVEVVKGEARPEGALPNLQIVTIPGPSALTAALSISGIPSSEFTFLGFLPHKKGRETLFKEISEASRPYVFYESTHRILKALESLDQHAPEKTITIAKELTKIHESVLTGTAKELLELFDAHPDKTKGEFVVIVS